MIRKPTQTKEFTTYDSILEPCDLTEVVNTKSAKNSYLIFKLLFSLFTSCDSIMGILHSRILAEFKKMRSSLTAPSIKPRPTQSKVLSSAVNIQSLPQELLLYIFSFLSPTDLCNTASKVCRHWEVLHRDPHLYNALEFRDGEESTNTAIMLLKRAPWLKALTVVDRTDVKKILEEVCLHNHQIRVLVLKKLCGSLRLNASVMKKIIQNCTELHTLKLYGCYVRGEVFYKNLSAQLPRLRTVHFVHGGKLSSGSVFHLVNSCCLNLEDLRIYNNYSPLGSYMDISDVDITALCNRFCKTLRSLKLDFGIWSQRAFSALQKCDRLEALGIYEAHSMSSEGILAITTMPSLRYLEITCCSVPVSTWIQLFTSNALMDLVYLNLCRCNVTDEVAVAIGAHLRNLQTVGMTGRLAKHPEAAESVSVKGVKSVIKGCSRLHVMELLYMDHTVQGAILLIPKYLPRLKKLVIFQESSLEWESVKKIRTKMPELIVEYII